MVESSPSYEDFFDIVFQKVKAKTRLTNDRADDSHPAWSPDGSRIAFTSGRHGNSEIYVMDADGSNQTRLTNNPAEELGPCLVSIANML